eukprot:2772183-Amphidinium_carterae.1
MLAGAFVYASRHCLGAALAGDAAAAMSCEAAILWPPPRPAPALIDWMDAVEGRAASASKATQA